MQHKKKAFLINAIDLWVSYLYSTEFVLTTASLELWPACTKNSTTITFPTIGPGGKS